ncbi:MAG: glycine--tRNA ligase subunit beta, partial [bacterium]
MDLTVSAFYWYLHESDMTQNALLEIGVENLPARFVGPALVQLEESVIKRLVADSLEFKRVKVTGTYKRLIVLIERLEEKSAEQTKEIAGPPVRLLRDEGGAWTAQSLGFARSHGVSPEELVTVKSSKGEFLAVRRTIPGEPAVKLLSKIFFQAISSLQFPKNMVWESSQFRFARPVRWLTALYGSRIIPFSVAGVRSGRKTFGLSCLGSKPVNLAEAGRYLKLLENKCVVADISERRQLLEKLLDQAGKRMKLTVDADETLLNETVYLVEHPVPVTGHFSLKFLKLPEELLCMVLRKQLKFFPVRGTDGKLQPHFVGVRDGISEGQKEVQEGYESVVEARLSDAVFFFER